MTQRRQSCSRAINRVIVFGVVIVAHECGNEITIGMDVCENTFVPILFNISVTIAILYIINIFVVDKCRKVN